MHAAFKNKNKGKGKFTTVGHSAVVVFDRFYIIYLSEQ